MAKAKKTKLTAREELFCRHYIKTLSLKDAAILAGFSKRTPFNAGSRLASKPYIQARIEQLRKEIQDEIVVDATSVLREYKKLAFSNIQDIMLEGMQFEDIKALRADVGSAIESVAIERRTTIVGEAEVVTENVKIKMHNKISALDAIGRHLGLFEKDNKQQQTTIEVNLV